jgi:hypothetical protein
MHILTTQFLLTSLLPVVPRLNDSFGSMGTATWLIFLGGFFAAQMHLGRTIPELESELAHMVNAFDPWTRDRGNSYVLQRKGA